MLLTLLTQTLVITLLVWMPYLQCLSMFVNVFTRFIHFSLVDWIRFQILENDPNCIFSLRRNHAFLDMKRLGKFFVTSSISISVD